jgi:DNA-binding response OmpR family regulator
LPTPQTILIVEDHADLRAAFATILQVSGYRVIQADDGLTALRLLDFTKPDLIILDLFLPTVNGFVMQQEIAARAELRDIPIVVVTAASSREIGAIDVACILQKPVDPEDLLAAVRRCLTTGAPPSTR